MRKFVVSFMLVTLIGSVAHAKQMYYTFSGSGNGSLAGQAFDTLDFSIAFQAETTGGNIADVSISLFGKGSYQFEASKINTFYIDSDGSARAAGVGYDGHNDIFDVFFPKEEYAEWDKESDVFYEGDGVLMQWNAGITVTDAANKAYVLDFNDTSNPGSFSASSTVPEPATVGLLAVVGAGLLFFRRRFMS